MLQAIKEVPRSPGACEAMGSNPAGPTIAFRPSADVLRSSGVVFVRPDFVGSKREMSPNRARHHFRAICGVSPRLGQNYGV